MTSLADEINCVVLSGKDVSKMLKGRNYRQRYERGYSTFVSYNSDKKQARLLVTEYDGDTRPLNLPIGEASRFTRIENKPSILPKTFSHIPRNANLIADMGD